MQSLKYTLFDKLGVDEIYTSVVRHEYLHMHSQHPRVFLYILVTISTGFQYDIYIHIYHYTGTLNFFIDFFKFLIEMN